MFYKKLSLFLVIFVLSTPQAHAFLGFTVKSAIAKSAKVLPDAEIIRLSKISDEVHGTARVGKELGEFNLPDEVLEDAFLRIAIHQGKITRETSEKMFSRLNGVPGFRTTLRKVIGNSDIGTVGHLNELEIADTAAMNGFKVLGIGEKFVDGLKKAPTDIDILLNRGVKSFAIEAKSYASTTKMPIDKFRADLDTLVIYKNQSTDNVVPIFTITNKPDDIRYLEMLQHESDKRGVQLIFGSPQSQIEQIKMLGDIL